MVVPLKLFVLYDGSPGRAGRSVGGLERLDQDLGVVQALEDRRDLPVDPEELVYRVHGSVDRVLHGEHDVAGKLGELPEEREVLRTVGDDLGAVLRTLIEAEIASRDASNTRARLKAATFPVIKTIEEFDLTASSIPAPTWDYLTNLEWIGAKENLALIGPAGTGKSHALIAIGHAAVHAAVHAGHKVRYFTAPDLVETLYRGLADNSVGKTIHTLLRNDLVILDEVGFAPLDDTGTQLLFRLVAAAYERRSLGIASHWPFDAWGRFLPEHTTAASMLDRLLHHAVVVITEGESYRMREAKTKGGRRTTKPSVP